MTSPNQRSLVAFFGRPIVGILGSLASILGIFASIYFFLSSRERPDLIYFVDPARAAVFRAGQASGLRVTRDGRPITTDVTAAQLVFWNAGRRSIRRDHILRPLTVSVPSTVEILEARIRKASRPIVTI